MGYRNALRVRVIGERGTIEWSGETPDLLSFTPLGGATMTRSKGTPDLRPVAQAFRRIPPGHPEGTYEGFANIYRAFAADLGASGDTLIRDDYPRAGEAARSIRFIHACVESSKRDAAWVRLDEMKGGE